MITRDALIEQAARAACSCQHSGHRHHPATRYECCYTQDSIVAALPVIVAAVLAEIRAQHHAYVVTLYAADCESGDCDHEPRACPTERTVICIECSQPDDDIYVRAPCPTVRLCDQIEVQMRNAS